MQIQINNLKFLILRLSLLSALFISMTSCQSSPSGQTLARPSYNAGENNQQQGVRTDKPVVDYITAHSLAELTQKATLIMIGRVEKADRVINMARNVNNISKPDLSILGLGQVYQIQAETFFKGADPGSPLFFIQPEGFLVKPQASEEPSAEDIELARKNSDHIPFIAGHRYLLFLEPLRGFEKQQYWVGVPHPWRFDVTDENNAYAESPANVVFPETTLPTILAKIKTALTPLPPPTVVSPLPTPPTLATAVPKSATSP